MNDMETVTIRELNNVAPDGSVVVYAPPAAKVLGIGFADSHLYVYLLHDFHSGVIARRKFFVTVCDVPFRLPVNARYVGTTPIGQDKIVYHVFDLGEVA